MIAKLGINPDTEQTSHVRLTNVCPLWESNPQPSAQKEGSVIALFHPFIL